MKNRLEQLKKDLVLEIKELAQNIAESESFVGLLSNEIKMKAIQEKFIVLKFLEQKKLSMDVFDMPILTTQEKREILKQEDMLDDDTPIVYDFGVENEEQIGVGKEQSIEEAQEQVMEQNDIETISRDEFPEPDSLNDEIKIQQESIQKKQTEEPDINTSWEQEIEESADYDKIDSKQKLLPICLDLNDNMGFLNYLFLGDKKSMDLVLNTLNHIQDSESTQMYLKDLRTEMNWGQELDEYVERLQELALKRFD